MHEPKERQKYDRAGQSELSIENQQLRNQVRQLEAERDISKKARRAAPHESQTQPKTVGRPHWIGSISMIHATEGE